MCGVGRKILFIELIVRAKHYKDTDFCGVGNCSLEKAAIEQYKTVKSFEFVDCIRIDNVIYNHKIYGRKDFELDKEKAASLNYSSEVIRTIKLTPII